MKKISGVTMIEMLIGIVISSIIIAAMYTTYSIINNTYSRVTDVAGISKSGRDIVSMIMRDVRMAGYKYYYGYNKENELRPEGEKIPRYDYLEFIPGDTDASERKSHAPIVIYRNTIGDKTKKPGTGDPLAPGYTILDTSTKVNNSCCDQIHIVFGDFDAKANIAAGEQYYKKYKISYFARALEKDGDQFDFSDFKKVKNPKEIKQITKVLRRMLKKGKGGLYILTARSTYKPIRKYLSEIDIDVSKIYVTALSSNNPKDKADCQDYLKI